jgi:hypothetical protein
VIPTATWTKLEGAILDGIRADVRVRCAARRHDLPSGAIAAVECQPGPALASRVGFYLFASRPDAVEVYRERVIAEGLGFDMDHPDPRFPALAIPEWEHPTGPCARDWMHIIPVDCLDRELAFANGEGYANYRVVTGRIYIDVLGTQSDIDALRLWAWAGSSTETYSVPADTGRVPFYQTLWCGGDRPADAVPLCGR